MSIRGPATHANPPTPRTATNESAYSPARSSPSFSVRCERPSPVTTATPSAGKAIRSIAVRKETLATFAHAATLNARNSARETRTVPLNENAKSGPSTKYERNAVDVER